MERDVKRNEWYVMIHVEDEAQNGQVHNLRLDVILAAVLLMTCARCVCI